MIYFSWLRYLNSKTLLANDSKEQEQYLKQYQKCFILLYHYLLPCINYDEDTTVGNLLVELINVEIDIVSKHLDRYSLRDNDQMTSDIPLRTKYVIYSLPFFMTGLKWTSFYNNYSSWNRVIFLLITTCRADLFSGITAIFSFAIRLCLSERMSSSQLIFKFPAQATYFNHAISEMKLLIDDLSLSNNNRHLSNSNNTNHDVNERMDYADFHLRQLREFLLIKDDVWKFNEEKELSLAVRFNLALQIYLICVSNSDSLVSAIEDNNNNNNLNNNNNNTMNKLSLKPNEVLFTLSCIIIHTLQLIRFSLGESYSSIRGFHGMILITVKGTCYQSNGIGLPKPQMKSRVTSSMPDNLTIFQNFGDTIESILSILHTPFTRNIANFWKWLDLLKYASNCFIFFMKYARQLSKTTSVSTASELSDLFEHVKLNLSKVMESGWKFLCTLDQSDMIQIDSKEIKVLISEHLELIQQRIIENPKLSCRIELKEKGLKNQWEKISKTIYDYYDIFK